MQGAITAHQTSQSGSPGLFLGYHQKKMTVVEHKSIIMRGHPSMLDVIRKQQKI